MARLPRLVISGQPLHLIQRGNNRSVTFFADEDYQLFCDTLYQASQRFGCAIHAYVLPQTLDAIRCATNDGAILGHEHFREQIEAGLRRRVTRLTHGGDRRGEAFQVTKEEQCK